MVLNIDNSYAFGSAEGLASSMSRARTCTWSAQRGDIVTTYMYVVRSEVVKDVVVGEASFAAAVLRSSVSGSSGSGPAKRIP